MCANISPPPSSLSPPPPPLLLPPMLKDVQYKYIVLLFVEWWKSFWMEFAYLLNLHKVLGSDRRGAGGMFEHLVRTQKWSNNLKKRQSNRISLSSSSCWESFVENRWELTTNQISEGGGIRVAKLIRPIRVYWRKLKCIMHLWNRSYNDELIVFAGLRWIVVGGIHNYILQVVLIK